MDRHLISIKDSIKGCAIRLIQTDEDLNTMTVLSSYVFDEDVRVDKVKAEFSIDGKYLVLYSNENKFIKVYEISHIQDIISDIKNQNILVDLKEKDDIQEVSFGNN